MGETGETGEMGEDEHTAELVCMLVESQWSHLAIACTLSVHLTMQHKQEEETKRRRKTNKN